MGETKYRLSGQASEDLDDLWLFVAQDNPSAARGLIGELFEKISFLAEFPQAGRRREELLPGLRSFPVGSYVIFYRLRENRVEIVRVSSAARDLETLFSKR